MSLGEAFVEVRADLRPFARDLRRNVRPIVQAFEAEVNRATSGAMLGASQQSGRQVGDRLSRGIRQSITHQLGNKNAFIVVASALAGALDDGISALPTEVKAAIVGGILAVSPLIAGALAGAISAGVGVGLVGIGVLLGAQFEEVQERAVDFGREIRNALVESARDFIPAIFSAFDQVETRIRRLRPVLDQIFNVSSNFLEPLVQGGLDALESIIDAIGNQLNNLKPFVDELGAAFAVLGDAIATSLQILIATGEDGRSALRDLIAILAIMLVSVASLIFALTRLYGAFRTVVRIVSDILGPLSGVIFLLDLFFDVIDRRTNENKSFVNTNTDMTNSFEGLIAATQGETKALEEYADKLAKASDAAKSNLELNVAWEESLDDIAASLKENGKTLDEHTDKGRNNIKEFIEGLRIAEERALLRVQKGELTSEQAAAQYQKEINQLRVLATQAGLSEQEFNDLFNEIINTSSVRISTSDMGLDQLNGALGAGVGSASKLFNLLKLIQHLGRTIGAGAIAGAQNFADGGIHYTPNIVRVAEAGPEVTIPLTRPARAAQLMAQSGLSSMLSGGGPTQILVFVGNEQLDARTVRIVERSNQSQSRELAQGPRRF